VQITATDPDYGKNGMLAFYLVPNDNMYFAINSAGVISTTTWALDRDNGPQPQVYLTVEVRDAGVVPLSAFCTIR